MINYEMFMQVVKETFMDYLPEQMKEDRNLKLEFRQVEKVNITKDVICIERDGINVSPILYINDMYEQFQETHNIQEVLQYNALNIVCEIKKAPKIIDGIDMKDAANNIVFQLINTEQNKKLLNEIPNRKVHDLSIIYRWVVKVDENGIQSSIIRNSLADKLELSEEQLFSLAIDNTKRILPPTIKSMNEVVRDMFLKDGMPIEIADMMIGEIPEENTMWVISNEKGINGACSLLYEDKLNELAETIGGDLYIMPSSVHEVIAVSSAIGDPNELAQMVAEINMDQVALDERLSNQVYHYDKDLRKLSIATDTPNKRLDGMLLENNEVRDKSR